MPEEQEGILDLNKVPRQKAADFKSVYSNNAGSSATFHEVRLIFGQILAGPDQPTPVIEHSVSVSMTWEHALQLRDLLSRLITGFEKDQGPIRKQAEISKSEAESKPLLPTGKM